MTDKVTVPIFLHWSLLSLIIYFILLSSKYTDLLIKTLD